MSLSVLPFDRAALAASRDALRASEPRLYPPDVARRLGISEAELLALDEGDGVRRLRADWVTLLTGLQALGDVLALTRNHDAVHEKTGRYEPVHLGERHALVLGDAIDLRIFPAHWCHLFARVAGAADGGRASFQLFDRDGSAVHKIFLTAASDRAAFMRLVDRLEAPDASPPLAIEPPAARPTPRPDAVIDRAGLLDAWDALRDTHDFHPMLERFGVARVQALRLAGPPRACPVRPVAVRAVLTEAAMSGLPIMVFVGNPGTIQIHTGPIARVEPRGPWLNVLDPGFNLHLRETAIAGAWIVEKPTTDGPVTSLELFDAEDRAIATLFGRRKPGEPEDPVWRALMDRQRGRA